MTFKPLPVYLGQLVGGVGKGWYFKMAFAMAIQVNYGIKSQQVAMEHRMTGIGFGVIREWICVWGSAFE